MAKYLYDKAKTAFAKGEIDLLNDDIRVILVDTANYPVSQSTDEFLSDVPVASRVATSGALASKTVVDPGVFDAANVTFTSVSGDISEALVGYKHTGVEGTSALIWYDDEASGLPITPNGQDILLTWDAGGIMNL